MTIFALGRTSRLPLLLAMALLAIMLLLPAPAGALPPGSYRDSCRDCYTKDSQLHCDCRNRTGKWARTWMYYADCYGNIANVDGRMVCTDIGQDLPGGSWRNSCTRWRVRRDTLLAECKNDAGNWVRSRIRFKDCGGKIMNDNGHLTCAKDPRPVPGGSWRNSCRRWQREGNILRAECKNPQGHWIFSTLNLKGCRQAPTNCNGRLACGGCR